MNFGQKERETVTWDHPTLILGKNVVILYEEGFTSYEKLLFLFQIEKKASTVRPLTTLSLCPGKT